jgi:hypothetical protein
VVLAVDSDGAFTAAPGVTAPSWMSGRWPAADFDGGDSPDGPADRGTCSSRRRMQDTTALVARGTQSRSPDSDCARLRSR